MTAAWRFLALALTLVVSAAARPVEFNLPAQPLGDALLAFSKQAQVNVLFAFAEVQHARSQPVVGRFEPEAAIHRLLEGTSFTARRNLRGKYVVTAAPPRAGIIQGRAISSDGSLLLGAQVMVPAARLTAAPDRRGNFRIEGVPAGTHHVIATAPGRQSVQLHDIAVTAGRTTRLDVLRLASLSEPASLAPYVVAETAEAHQPFDHDPLPPAPRTAAGNLDLRRTVSDVLPYTVINRERILRSGVVDLYHVLQRDLLEATSADPRASSSIFGSGSTNLSLRGYGAEETVILINGRRLPELLTASSESLPPDVSFIPLSLVQRVEVLPSSASALYSGNAVGGVVNIVLRPDVDVNATELTTTYTNALHGYDAPQSSVSLMHGRSFLGGALRVRLNLHLSDSHPPTEAELGYRRVRAEPATPLDEPLFRATPNVRTAEGEPLFAAHDSPVTSVAPGATGAEGLAGFRGREGIRSTELYDTPGGLASSLNSSDYAYGRAQKRWSSFVSAVYDVNPWLQLGCDAIFSRTSLHRGYDLLTADLELPAESSLNPFGRDVLVSLNETPSALGEHYSSAEIDFSSLVLGAMAKLPQDWRVMVDTQYARNRVRYRGLLGADQERWQQLVFDGRYNPLRDTQRSPAPAEFYDEVLIYRGRRGEAVTLGDYHALDTAVRAMREDLPVPTGEAVLNMGFDYRFTWMDDYLDQPTYGNGAPAAHAELWRGRTLERLSTFAELQAPVVPQHWLPRWIRRADAELAGRYIAADSSQESNFAPTVGLKLSFANGLSLRGSVATSSRFPNPQMARPYSLGPDTGGLDIALVQDPRRRNESYEVPYREQINLDLQAEAATTQTVGVMFETNRRHQLRASLDFFDTRKTNESILIEPQAALYLESIWPERVRRALATPTEPVGRVTSITTGRINAAWRHSQNWNASLSYNYGELWGGELELYTRWIYFERFDLQLLPNQPIVDQLDAPDGSVPGLLRHRANFGGSWANRAFGFGFDGRYFHSRKLQPAERTLQRNSQVDPHVQIDAYVHTDLRRWISWPGGDYGLRAQVRVNNVFGPNFPYYWATGVQPHGDWRGRTYSLSVTAVF